MGSMGGGLHGGDKKLSKIWKKKHKESVKIVLYVSWFYWEGMMDIDEYKLKFGGQEDSAPGWDAISEHLGKHYKSKEDGHFSCGLHAILGGPIIDGVSVYFVEDPVPHIFYVTYGLSSLYYDEESVGGEYSGWGYELGIRINWNQSQVSNDPENIPQWPINLLMQVAQSAHDNQKVFQDGHTLRSSSALDGGDASNLTCLFFLNDPVLKEIETVHGKVQFIEMFGLTDDELASLPAEIEKRRDCVASIAPENHLFVTDMKRRKKMPKKSILGKLFGG